MLFLFVACCLWCSSHLSYVLLMLVLVCVVRCVLFGVRLFVLVVCVCFLVVVCCCVVFVVCCLVCGDCSLRVACCLLVVVV